LSSLSRMQIAFSDASLHASVPFLRHVLPFLVAPENMPRIPLFPRLWRGASPFLEHSLYFHRIDFCSINPLSRRPLWPAVLIASLTILTLFLTYCSTRNLSHPHLKQHPLSPSSPLLRLVKFPATTGFAQELLSFHRSVFSRCPAETFGLCILLSQLMETFLESPTLSAKPLVYVL